MRLAWILLLITAFSLSVAACTEQASPPGDGAADTTAAPDAGPPIARADTLAIEGMAEPVTLNRYDAPGLPFVTAIPGDDFVPETTSSGEGESVTFVASFGGAKNPEAFVQFFFPSDESGYATPEALRRFVTDQLAPQNHWQIQEPRAGAPPACTWADQSYRFVRTDGRQTFLGHVCLGTHVGRPFFVLTQMPEEYADGFGPRAAVLLEHLRWRDTGEGL